MSKISRPTQKVTVFDPETGGLTEAATTDTSEMIRRAKIAIKDMNHRAKKAIKNVKTKTKQADEEVQPAPPKVKNPRKK
jgi:hypothetical protein